MTNCARADPTYVVLVFLVSTLCCLGIIIFAYMFRVDTWVYFPSTIIKIYFLDGSSSFLLYSSPVSCMPRQPWS